MALGRDPDHTVIVEVGDVRPFSDIAGRHVVRLNNDAAKRMDLTERLKTCGCSVDTSGKDWLEAGDFSTTGTAFRIEATSSKTHFVSQTVELLEDMSSNLRSCIDDFGCQFQLAGEAHPLPANRIVIYRAFPFEFSTQLFSTFRQNPRFRKAFGIYTECLRKIIEEGTDRIGDWWDFSIYGKLDDPMADSRTITAIRNLYVAGGQDNDPFVDRENPPDTSYIYTNSAVRSRGILLIGELDLEKMRDDPEVDELGNVMPRIKQWHHGYWMMDITYSNGEVKFENCLITSNQDVLKAMRLEFEAIKKRSKLYKLNSDMTAQKKEQLMREIKSDLMCGDGTENEL